MRLSSAFGATDGELDLIRPDEDEAVEAHETIFDCVDEYLNTA